MLYILLFTLFIGGSSMGPRIKLNHGSYEMLFSHERGISDREKNIETKVPLIPSSNTLFPEVEATKEELLRGIDPKKKPEKGTTTTEKPETTSSVEESTTIEESTEIITEGDNSTSTETGDNTTVCFDMDPKCKKYAKQCDVQVYEEMLIKRCAKTCNKCGEFAKLPKHERCKDTYSRCSILGDRFCTASAYSKETKIAKCAKTCGFC